MVLWHIGISHHLQCQISCQSTGSSSSYVICDPAHLKFFWETNRRWITNLGACTHVGDLLGIPGLCFQHGPALHVVATQGENKQMLCLCLCYTVFQINKKKKYSSSYGQSVSGYHFSLQKNYSDASKKLYFWAQCIAYDS